jgi:hypothetical protein
MFVWAAYDLGSVHACLVYQMAPALSPGAAGVPFAVLMFFSCTCSVYQLADLLVINRPLSLTVSAGWFAHWQVQLHLLRRCTYPDFIDCRETMLHSC